MSCTELHRLGVGLGALLVWGCSIRLDELPEKEPEIEKPLATGCPLLGAEGSTLTGVWGRARRTSIDGEPAWVVDSASAQGSAPAASIVRGAPDDDLCRAGPGVEIGSAWTSEADGTKLTVLDVVSPVDAELGAARLYFKRDEPDPSAAFGVKTAGFGSASFVPLSGAFDPNPSLLWSGDRPSFGIAALERAGTTFVFGCREARFLEGDCWLASVPTSQADDPSSYRYERGGGNKSALLDEAFPMISAGTSISVAFLLDRNRFLMAYVPPLGSTIVLRTGLDVDGPWSGPVEAARCALPGADPEAFCGDVTLHADLPRSSDQIWLSYAIHTFAGSARSARPADYRSRIASIDIPRSLP